MFRFGRFNFLSSLQLETEATQVVGNINYAMTSV